MQTKTHYGPIMSARPSVCSRIRSFTWTKFRKVVPYSPGTLQFWSCLKVSLFPIWLQIPLVLSLQAHDIDFCLTSLSFVSEMFCTVITGEIWKVIFEGQTFAESGKLFQFLAYKSFQISPTPAWFFAILSKFSYLDAAEVWSHSRHWIS